ncbi:peptidoglycan DD-metalloendopeptidase family protein [candidate division KSB1 bacterium]|nr:peptidoglycan DD-metalloendopeptidase family protein [candidate division KSB1 bacterium]
MLKLFLPVALFALVVSCGDDQSITGPGKPVSFEVSPVTYSAIRLATPMGNLNPPGHTFPSDHMGFYLAGDQTYLVRAYAAGTIRTVYYNSGFDDYRIEFKHTNTVTSYLDHVENPCTSIKVGTNVQPGDSVGWATSYLDIGVTDYDTTRYFIVPGRYHEKTLHAGDVYLYFQSDVRERLLAKNNRTAAPRGGKIDFDIDGALAGNWFLQGTPVTWEASSYLYAGAQLAFVYDMWDPSKIRIVCGGGWSAAPFCCLVDGNAPDPASVTQNSGFIKYQTIHAASSDVVAVQLIEPRHLKVQVFADTTRALVSGFTENAKIYVR